MYIRNIRTLLYVFLILLVFTQPVFSTMNVVTHMSDGTLVDGMNRLTSGADFLLPAIQPGGHYYILNKTGQSVNIIPGAEGLSLGTLPAGHQGILSNSLQLEIIDIGQNNYYLWKGTLTDGGNYYMVVDPTPKISISPSTASFGAVLEGEQQDLNLLISNAGTAVLNISDIALLDPLEAPFELVTVQDGCSNQGLSPATSCTFTVRFTSQAGDFADTFNVPSNDPVTPSSIINVTGTGTAISTNYSVYTDFSEDGIGSGVPAGWTERWETGKANHTVVDSTIFPGQKDLVANTTSGARRLISFDAADSISADVDLLMLFSDPVNEGSIHTDTRLFARASGSAGSETAYFLTTDSQQRLVEIYKYVDGVMSVLTVGDFPIPFNSTSPWWARFRVEGTLLRAKIWPYGSLEPTAWQLASVDSEITGAGWQGIGYYWIGDHVFHQFVTSALPGEAAPVNGFGISPIIPVTINLDAETGNTTGWVPEFGEIQVTSSYQRSGSYAFQGGAGDYRAHQRIDLTQSGITLQQLKQDAKFSFRAWQRAFNWNNDPGRIGLRFLDANQVEISTVYTDWDFKHSFYAPKGIIETIPVNAAFVDIILEGQYISGASAGAYFDDLEIGIGVSQ